VSQAATAEAKRYQERLRIMFAKWLRDGLGSGRTTVSYPRDEKTLDEYTRWNRVPEVRQNSGDCEDCTEVCPTGAIEKIRIDKESRFIIDPGKCICCGICETQFPQAFSHGRLDAVETADAENADLGTPEGMKFRSIFKRSVNIRHIDAGSCNACESDILALTNPYYNFHRLGFFFTASPRHADILLVTGAVTVPMKNILIETYEAMPKPRIVIASGMCAIGGGPFSESGRCVGRVEDFVPVDVRIPGCPPNPFALINGIITAINRQERGQRK
jgi:formate hydrogenlyase subunit 7